MIPYPLRLRPPKTKSSPAKHPLCYTRLHLLLLLLPIERRILRPCTRPPIFNQRPHPSQSTTINQVAYYSVANPVEYLQEKARRSTSVLLLKSHPPHARLSGGEEQTNKSATPRTPKSHPTNLPTLQSAYSNRPTDAHHAERRAKDPAAEETTSGHKSNARNCPAAATMSPHIPPYAVVVVNHPQS